MLRRLFRSGNSVVVSLSKEFLAFLGLRVGDEVLVTLDAQAKHIFISSPEFSTLASDVDERFARQVSEFIERYRPTLEALAGK